VAGLFPLLTGYLFDQSGNFSLALLVLSVFCALAAMLSLQLQTIGPNEAGKQ
jgi:cyanate permease